MPLNERQISDLARAIETYLSLSDLIQLADRIDLTLGSIAPDGSLLTRAEVLLKTVNTGRPPRDRELLEAIVQRGPAGLKTIANQLLTPTYHPPNARDAVLLGRTGFFGRDGLRQGVEDFARPSHFTSRILIIEGYDPGGKTYSWEYLRHRAVEAGAVPRRLGLKDAAYEPRDLVEAVGQLLRLDVGTLPRLVDRPQHMRTNALLMWFQGQLDDIRRAYWLVIDDLNEPAVSREIRACAYALAKIVEQVKPDNLWVALLGYNEQIIDREMRNCVHDMAAFPTPAMFARDFIKLAAISSVPLSPERANKYAELLFSRHQIIDRTAMDELTSAAELLGQKLLKGLQA
jgi:hypothetical protein